MRPLASSSRLMVVAHYEAGIAFAYIFFMLNIGTTVSHSLKSKDAPGASRTLVLDLFLQKPFPLEYGKAFLKSV